MSKLERLIMRATQFFVLYFLLDVLWVALECALDGGPQTSNADGVIGAVFVIAFMRRKKRRWEWVID